MMGGMHHSVTTRCLDKGPVIVNTNIARSIQKEAMRTTLWDDVTRGMNQHREGDEGIARGKDDDEGGRRHYVNVEGMVQGTKTTAKRIEPLTQRQRRGENGTRWEWERTVKRHESHQRQGHKVGSMPDAKAHGKS